MLSQLPPTGPTQTLVLLGWTGVEYKKGMRGLNNQRSWNCVKETDWEVIDLSSTW